MITDEQIEQAAIEDNKSAYFLDIGSKDAIDDFKRGAKWMQAQQPQWISVSDRLPEHSGWYLVCFPNIQTSFFYIEPDYKGEHHKFTDKGVTHWMPLPAAPNTL